MKNLLFLLSVFLFISCNVYKTWQPTLPRVAEKPIPTSKEIVNILGYNDWDLDETKIVAVEGTKKYAYSIWYHGKNKTGYDIKKDTIVEKTKLELYLNQQSIPDVSFYENAVKELPAGDHCITVIGDLYEDLYVFINFWSVLEATPNSHKAKITSYKKGKTSLSQIYFTKK